jgi:methionine-rich copper-binding protein CopC
LRVPSTRRAALLATAGAILAMAPAAGTARAHVKVVASSPVKNATLAKAPGKVTVTFTKQLLEGALEVRRSGVVVSTGPNGIDPANVTRLRVKLRPRTGAGTYRVSWQVVGPDGHRQRGSFTFTVRKR